jgi:anti-sigma regulatory factor (Ser/Thr protein kinase)
MEYSINADTKHKITIMNQPLKKKFEIALNGHLDEISVLAAKLHEASQYFSLSQEIENQLNLILEELYTNSVNYGFKDTSDPKVMIELWLDQSKLEFTYQDNGQAFNPLEINDPDLTLSLDDRPIGGLGIFFIKTLTNQVEYHYDGHFNHIKMLKKI